MSDKAQKKQSGFFSDLMSGPENLEQSLLGPDYNYVKKIKNPSQLGMSSDGSLGALENDIGGLINYVRVLVDGRGSGTTVGGPLGNKFFLQTGGTCKAKDTGESVTRYLYVNNVPTGNIPFISQAAGMDFTEFEGLVPGILEDLEVFDPFRIFSAFQAGDEPECQKIKMKVTPSKNSNQKDVQTEYVADYDIRYLDSCLFEFNNKQNPVTKGTCAEGFNTRGGIQKHPSSGKHTMHYDPSAEITEAVFFLILSLLLLFVVYKLLSKKM